MTATPTAPNPDQAIAQAKASAEADVQRYTLAAAAGSSDPHLEARRYVVKQFFSLHRKDASDPVVMAFLRRVDFTKPVQVVDRRSFPPDAPARGGFMSMILGQRDAFLLTEKHPPVDEKSPLIALRYKPTQPAD